MWAFAKWGQSYSVFHWWNLRGVLFTGHCLCICTPPPPPPPDNLPLASEITFHRYEFGLWDFIMRTTYSVFHWLNQGVLKGHPPPQQMGIFPFLCCWGGGLLPPEVSHVGRMLPLPHNVNDDNFWGELKKKCVEFPSPPPPPPPYRPFSGMARHNGIGPLGKTKSWICHWSLPHHSELLTSFQH